MKFSYIYVEEMSYSIVGSQRMDGRYFWWLYATLFFSGQAKLISIQIVLLTHFAAQLAQRVATAVVCLQCFSVAAS